MTLYILRLPVLIERWEGSEQTGSSSYILEIRTNALSLARAEEVFTDALQKAVDEVGGGYRTVPSTR
jgi:hypothetical protein